MLRHLPRHTLLAATLLFGCTLVAAGQAPDQLYTATKNQLAATKVVIAQQTAWNKGDLDAYLSHYKDAADTTALLVGPVRGLANIRSAFHIGFPSREQMGTLEQTEVEPRELGENFVLIAGKYHLSRSRKFGGDTDGTFFEILEKTATGWFVVFSQTS